jgi:hypothetical protein
MAGDDDSEGDDGEESCPDDDDRSGTEDRFDGATISSWCCRLPWAHNYKSAFKSDIHPLSTDFVGRKALPEFVLIVLVSERH